MPYVNGVWQPEDDSSANKLAEITKTDSTYMQAARAAGQRQAQARGLQNSSIAGTSGEAAAIAAAQPFALNDAQQVAAKNLSFQGFGQQQTLDAANNAAIQARDAANNTANMERLNAQLASNERISGQEAQNKLILQQLEKETQERIASMNVKANSQDKATNAALSASNIYASKVNNINSNKDMPADARASALSAAKMEYDADIGLIEQLYNIDLNWSSGGTGSGGVYNPSSGGGSAGDGSYTPPGGNPSGMSREDLARNIVTNSWFDDSPAKGSAVAYTDPAGNQYDAGGRYLGTV